MPSSKLKSLGQETRYFFDKPAPTILEKFENKHPENFYLINLFCNEFTSICPVTGQPDWGTFRIRYVPNKFCVESKSLKLYLFSFRNHGEFHEDVTNRIAKDLFRLLQPYYLEIYGDFHSRGGIAICPFVQLWGKVKPVQEKKIQELLR